MGMEYLNDMQELINDIISGPAPKEPSNLGRPDLDTYFRHGSAIIVWNAAQAEEYSR